MERDECSELHDAGPSLPADSHESQIAPEVLQCEFSRWIEPFYLDGAQRRPEEGLGAQRFEVDGYVDAAWPCDFGRGFSAKDSRTSYHRVPFLDPGQAISCKFTGTMFDPNLEFLGRKVVVLVDSPRGRHSKQVLGVESKFGLVRKIVHVIAGLLHAGLDCIGNIFLLLTRQSQG